jgi:hypothetical protein
MKSNKIIASIIVLVVLLANLPFLVGRLWPRINDVSTGQTPEYPDLLPQRFRPPAGYDQVFDAAVDIARASGWTIREADRDRGVIEAVATTRFLRFKDEVTVTVTKESEFVVVNMRSRSSAGKRDLGANARRIRAFQTDLAKRFQAVVYFDSHHPHSIRNLIFEA